MPTSRLALLLVLAALACRPDDTGKPDDTGTPVDRGPFPEYCEGAWDADLAARPVNPLEGNYLGAYDVDPGTFLMNKVIPEYPYQVTAIRLAFVGDPGPARVHLADTFGRSYPAIDIWGDGELIPPIDIQVDDPDQSTWIEIDISAEGLFLRPTQHYAIVVEQMEGGPSLALESLPSGEFSRALMLIPGEEMAYGSEGNFRAELMGNYFCRWTDEQRWFGKDLAQPWDKVASAYETVTDLDGDGHDDLVLYSGGPQAFLGDGRGGFTSLGAKPFPDSAGANFLLFGDIDNDGDEDAFAAYYVTADSDGDHVTVAEGDCNDTTNDVDPAEEEVPDNLIDDDCDGVADDGLDTKDHDADGFSIADGDCDDTQPLSFPENPEVQDALDNDCDQWVDEDFVDRILLNDGSGNFSRVATSGLEGVDPTTAAGFGDGDGDGNLDIYLGNWLELYPYDSAVQDRYGEGRGDGTFVDATEAVGMVVEEPYSCYGVEWNDWNNDGFQDVFVGNYHLFPNHQWANQGDGTFVDVAEEVGLAFDDVESPYAPDYMGGHTYGGDFGDFDNDGDMDFYMANLAHPRTQPWGDPSMFTVNQGAGGDYAMVNQREEYGFVYDEGDVNAQWADYDLDGDLDLAIASLYTGHYARLYRNDVSDGGVFTDITYEAGIVVHDAVSVIWADVDEDGDMDLLLADRADAPYVHLYTNRYSGNGHWVELDLEGVTSNRDAAGARVSIVAGGVTRLREVSLGNGLANTQKPRMLHFGLGDADSIDSVTVSWTGGSTETVTDIAVDHRYRIVEGQGRGTEVY